jgi:hypothetical protein
MLETGERGAGGLGRGKSQGLASAKRDRAPIEKAS